MELCGYRHGVCPDEGGDEIKSGIEIEFKTLGEHPLPLNKYVHQLIEDLESAKSRVPEVPKCLYEEPMEGLWHIAEWENAPSKPLSEWFGISKNMFPPAGRLSADALEKLAFAMSDLWVAFNFIPVLPDNLPAEYVYKILADNWDREAQYLSDSRTWLEFCSYDPSHCPFPIEYCQLREECLKPPDMEGLGDHE